MHAVDAHAGNHALQPYLCISTQPAQPAWGPCSQGEALGNSTCTNQKTTNHSAPEAPMPPTPSTTTYVTAIRSNSNNSERKGAEPKSGLSSKTTAMEVLGSCSDSRPLEEVKANLSAGIQDIITDHWISLLIQHQVVRINMKIESTRNFVPGLFPPHAPEHIPVLSHSSRHLEALESAVGIFRGGILTSDGATTATLTDGPAILGDNCFTLVFKVTNMKNQYWRGCECLIVKLTKKGFARVHHGIADDIWARDFVCDLVGWIAGNSARTPMRALQVPRISATGKSASSAILQDFRVTFFPPVALKCKTGYIKKGDRVEPSPGDWNWERFCKRFPQEFVRNTNNRTTLHIETITVYSSLKAQIMKPSMATPREKMKRLLLDYLLPNLALEMNWGLSELRQNLMDLVSEDRQAYFQKERASGVTRNIKKRSKKNEFDESTLPLASRSKGRGKRQKAETFSDEEFEEEYCEEEEDSAVADQPPCKTFGDALIQASIAMSSNHSTPLLNSTLMPGASQAPSKVFLPLEPQPKFAAIHHLPQHIIAPKPVLMFDPAPQHIQYIPPLVHLPQGPPMFNIAYIPVDFAQFQQFQQFQQFHFQQQQYQQMLLQQHQHNQYLQHMANQQAFSTMQAQPQPPVVNEQVSTPEKKPCFATEEGKQIVEKQELSTNVNPASS